MKKIFFCLSLFTLLISCSSNPSDSQSQGDNYDKTALLTNWADNIIIPSYVNFQTKVQSLVTATNIFTTSPTVVNLESLRNSWVESYIAYQYVSMYQLGKASEINFDKVTNTYPTNINGISNNILTSNTDFSLLTQIDKQGLPALDYMLNGLALNDTDIIAFYHTNNNASKYKLYLTALVNQLKSNIDIIVTSWTSSYRNSYIANTSNSVSGSVNVTTNLFVKNLESNIRSGKVGIPAGVFSNGNKFPEKVEAFYKKDISRELLRHSVKASHHFFIGRKFNGTTAGASLESYLDYLIAVRSNNKLSDVINSQFDSIFFYINNALKDDLSSLVNTDNSKMILTYDALQQNVIYMKLDMMQALNIIIDYVDSDGD